MSSVIRLEAGANTPLTANNPLLDELAIGFGWSIISGNGPKVELVPSAIMCDTNGNALSDEHMVFFNQLATADGSVKFVTGDDQEQIDIALNLIPDNVAKIMFVVYVDPDIRKPGTFAAVRNAYIRVADREDNDMVRFDLVQPNSDVNAMIFAELYRHNGNWKFRAIGQGFTTGIKGVADSFKVNL